MYKNGIFLIVGKIAYISKTPSEQLQISAVRQIVGIDIQSENITALEQLSVVTEETLSVDLLMAHLIKLLLHYQLF